jgi:hypothetical protein
MFPTDFAATLGALADPHSVLGHPGTGHGWQLGDVGKIHPLFPEQLTPAAGAGVQGHRYIYRGLSDLFRPGRLPAGEGPLTRLATRALGLAYPGAFGKGCRLALVASLELSILGLQRLQAGAQLGDLPLQLGHQDQQFLSAQ